MAEKIKNEKVSVSGEMLPGSLLVVISGPSGAGKSSITGRIREELGIDFSISATTRHARPGEENGREYIFLSREEFEKKIANGEFLEWAEVHGNLYGTLHSVIDEAIKNSRPLLLDVDFHGGLAIKLKYPGALLIFIAPPTLEELEKRLRARRTDSEDVIRRRLKNAREELENAKKYDVVVVNDSLERAQEECITLIKNHFKKAGFTFSGVEKSSSGVEKSS